MRITNQQFKTQYGGNIDTLKHKCAIAEQAEVPSEVSRKKYEYLEFKLQTTVAGFLNLYYPQIPFVSNPINLSLTKAQRQMNAAIQGRNFKCPDMIIFAARHGFNGMLLELKKESPYRLDGELKKSDHIQAQYESILRLRVAGFHARFYWEWETIKKSLNWYLGEAK